MSEHPGAWAEVRLADVCHVITDGTHKTPDYRDSGVRFISIKNIRPFQPIDWNSYVRFISREEHVELIKRCKPERDDILFPRIGTLGFAKRIDFEEEVSIFVGLGLLKPNKAVIRPMYLEYYMNAPWIAELSRERANGSGRLTLPLEESREFPVLLPPLEEQGRIVAEIEKQFTRLDAAVAALKRVWANLKRYRAAVLKAACEGRLVPTEAELARKEGRSYETGEQFLARILKERRAKWEADQLAKMHASGRSPENDDWKKKYKEPDPVDNSNLPLLPEGWVWASLEQSAWDADYGTSERCEYNASGLPVLRIPNITASRISLDDLKFATSTVAAESSAVLRSGDLLIIRTNGSRDLIGRAAVVVRKFDSPHLHASYLIRFRLLPELMAWIAAVWNTASVRDQIERMAATSAGQYNVSVGKLNRLVLPIAPVAEQIRIIMEIERQMSEFAAAESSCGTNLARADHLRQSILRRAFEGKLVPQDPNDEPASVLLERIRAERADKLQAVNRAPKPKRARVAAVEAS